MMEHQELTEKIIGCAFTVHNKLGYGFLESVYEKALLIELKKVGLSAESQKAITVYYDDQIVGEFKADMMVEKTILIELKAVQQIVKTHEVQLVNYLAATRMNIGLILNFAECKMEVKRKIRTLDRAVDF